MVCPIRVSAGARVTEPTVTGGKKTKSVLPEMENRQRTQHLRRIAEALGGRFERPAVSQGLSHVSQRCYALALVSHSACVSSRCLESLR